MRLLKLPNLLAEAACGQRMGCTFIGPHHATPIPEQAF